MKKRVKSILIIIILLGIIAGGVFVGYNIINDSNKLTVDEKKWINANLSTVQNVNVINNVDIFGNNGYGVFFDLIQDFQREYQLKVNPITYNHDDNKNNSGFKMSNSLDDKSVVIYDDYYVMISKKYELIKDISDIKGKKIGVIASDANYINSYLNNISFVSYDSYAKLEESFNGGSDIEYMIVPRYLYIGYCIKNNLNIIYHFGDIKSYYIYEMKENDEFSNIIKKFFVSWKKDNLKRSINSNLLNTLVYNLNLSDLDMSNIKSKVYRYGFITSAPYEVLSGGNYGGIAAEYLEGFSELSGVEFKYTKYKNYNKFINALHNGDIDIFFNSYTNINDYNDINTGINLKYDVIAKNSNDVMINSLNSLQYKEVYVLENSKLYESLLSISNVNIKTYKSIDELKKLGKKDCIIILDSDTYKYLSNNELRDYTSRYSGNANTTYNFKVSSNESFNKLLSSYIMIQNPDYLRVNGIKNYTKTETAGSFFGNIAKYLLIIVIAVILLFYILYKYAKRVKVTKKIKKEDKIKFIDQLTSLKNRNYLNENISLWNKNTIYPQSTIIIDLNKVHEINDTFGHDEGDKQIKAASNILIRTQLDNSDIIRTDGNEFLIYLVGYERRSVESYIRKLIREFKKLPYDYNAIITYSMIEDDIKTIEDSINEAIDEMKEKKQEI